MPKRKTELSDEERSKRLRETAREVEANATREEFDSAFKKIVPAKHPPIDDGSASRRRTK